MFQTKFVEKIKHHFNTFFFKSKILPFMIGYRHILRICNTYCFATAAVLSRTRLIVTLYWLTQKTGTFEMRSGSHAQLAAPRHLVIMDQWNGQQHAFAIKMFYKPMIVWKVRRGSSGVFSI
jgi:hypothetical protein